MIEVFRRHDRIPLGLRLCFRKHRNRRQISRRHRLEVEAAQPLGVEGRALVGIRKQRAQPPVAVLSNLLCRPVEATHMIIECRLHGTEVGGADALICGPTHTAPSSACEFDPQRSGTPDLSRFRDTGSSGVGDSGLIAPRTRSSTDRAAPSSCRRRIRGVAPRLLRADLAGHPKSPRRPPDNERMDNRGHATPHDVVGRNCKPVGAHQLRGRAVAGASSSEAAPRLKQLVL